MRTIAVLALLLAAGASATCVAHHGPELPTRGVDIDVHVRVGRDALRGLEPCAPACGCRPVCACQAPRGDR